ncbi:MAG: hypothetical protein ABF665_09280 [Gluconacetobacter sp.]
MLEGNRDRDLQRRMLVAMSADPVSGVWMGDFEGLNDAALLANLRYLEQHDLCASGIDFRGRPTLVHCSVITARGQDYLSADGGLSAELNTITVRLSAETVRQVLAARVDADDTMDEAEKSTIRKHLETIPEKGLEAVTSAILQSVLAHAPDAIQLLRTCIGL